MREIRIPGIRRVLRVSWSSDTVRREIDEEIQFHVDARADELVRLGASPDVARKRAEEEFGDIRASARDLTAVDHRRMGKAHREDLLMSFIDDLRYAWRALARRPALLIVTTIALSVGIAANAVMFGIVDQLLIQPPALVTAPDDVVRVYYRQTSRRGEFWTGPTTTYRVITKLRGEVKAFAGVAAASREPYTLGSGPDARSVDVELVSGNYFSLLGVRPAAGRLLTPEDERVPIGENVAVLSAGFARQQFGGDSIVGRDIRLQGETFRVVGIAPEKFSGIDRRRVDIWVPVTTLGAKDRGPSWHLEDNSWWLEGFARLAPGVTPEMAAGEATRWFRGIQREWAKEDRGEDTLGTVLLGSILPARGPNGFTPESKVSLWVLGVSAIVLIIACANVANLLIARTHQRRREIAVRMAMGVSRWRLMRLLLAEAVILAAIGAAVALLIAWAASPIVQQVLLPDIVWNDTVVDARVLFLTLIAMVACVLLAGIAPALQGLGTRVSESLKSASAQVAGHRSSLRFALLVTQAALAIVLLVGAGLFVKSLSNVASTDVGMDLD
ncbi:MAG: ABC transporter permease, partial [Gemmatimonadaceae bacterium]